MNPAMPLMPDLPSAAPLSTEPADDHGEAGSMLHALMRGHARGLGAPSLPATPDASHSIVIGELLAWSEGEAPRVRWAASPQDGVEAMSVVPIRAEHVGAPLALSLGAGLAQPLILGLLWQPGADRQVPAVDDAPSVGVPAVMVERDGGLAEEVVIGATQQLTLHCGEASITLTADGQILLRGEYISSHATGTQRIKGAAVRIN
ncbi:DUF6484 domain-containing protein [Roseateles sp.]|uniref:DUF6484 domain-containing protein n=1 Tax=Roseateles sp. TaxID=1971397 RepID=UPI002F41ADC3